MREQGDSLKRKQDEVVTEMDAAQAAVKSKRTETESQLAEAIKVVQARMNTGVSEAATSSSQSEALSASQREALVEANSHLRTKPESEYTDADWSERAFAAYAGENFRSLHT